MRRPEKSALHAGAGRISLRSPRKSFFRKLLARKKARLQALIAVARKLLHAIYGIFRTGLKYEGTKDWVGRRGNPSRLTTSPPPRLRRDINKTRRATLTATGTKDRADHCWS